LDAKEEIRQKLSIEDVVGDYVQLKKAGRNFKGLCPFHNDKNPSMMINPDKGIAWCFSCQTGGDIFRFVELIEKVDFPEALKILADKAGVIVPEYTGGGEKKKELKKEVQEVLEVSLQFFQKEFTKNSKVQEYWKGREISEEMSKKFGIGYAPDSFTATYEILREKGFSKEAITESGMCVEKDNKQGDFFDRFRHRLMIPIMNHQGKIIGFGGRELESRENQAKYLNSPESVLYSKSYTLFGLDLAKMPIKAQRHAVIVEGYMDVIASHQAGIENVIAVSGTALTIEQLHLLKRYTNKLTFCFDQDQPGKDATKRSLELAATEDFFVEIVCFDEAKDVDELIQQGAEKWKEALAKTIEPLDFFFNEAAERLDIKSLEGKKLFVEELLGRIASFSSVVLQQNYLKRLSERCEMPVKVLAEQLDLKKRSLHKILNKQYQGFQVNTQISNVSKPKKLTWAEQLIGMMLNSPQFIEEVEQKIIVQVFEEGEAKDVYKVLIEQYNPAADLEEILGSLPEQQQRHVKVWQMFAEESDESLNDEDKKKALEKLVQMLNVKNIDRFKNSLVKTMKDQSATKEEQQMAAVKMLEIQKLQIAVSQNT
jgi:DNA primase